ncbi:hypothetical protein CVT26_007189 [Gymnopilus dilepis]|uniref:Uncharacterized protein n=1 Tax=Gymnopilus dilepis TaxID=231916 RepID=A0A409W094_9AGAR|nr:hypothetical protein CVT26_007189 [Gymnopilus dilepis]
MTAEAPPAVDYGRLSRKEGVGKERRAALLALLTLAGNEDTGVGVGATGLEDEASVDGHPRRVRHGRYP